MEQLLLENEILMVRTRGVSPIPPEVAVNNSVSGPVLRASGVNWDWRKQAPYDAYDQVEFDVPIGSNWDNYDRFWVRMQRFTKASASSSSALSGLSRGRGALDLPLVLRPRPGGKPTAGLRRPRGSWPFTWSATAAFHPIAAR